MILDKFSQYLIFLTDGGLETSLIFLDQIDLPYFAAFPLLKSKNQIEILKDYYRPYLNLAQTHATGFILESPTWRANTDWGHKLGFSANQLAILNQKGIMLMKELRKEFSEVPTLISGCIGPRADGYRPTIKMTPQEALEYHAPQIETMKMAGADMVSAITMNYPEEALGIAIAARELNIPVVISFTLETDGRLVTGDTLKSVIQRVDITTGGYTSYFMINCSHPSHFRNELAKGGSWTKRIMGIRANASCKSHSELNDSLVLEAGNKAELAEDYAELQALLPNLRVLGGCCGTDVSHIKAISDRMLCLA